MKPAKFSIYVGSVLLVLAVVLAWTRINRDRQPDDFVRKKVQAQSQMQTRSALQSASQSPGADRQAPEPDAGDPGFRQGLQPEAPVLTRAEIDAAINDIEAAATSYDPEELPILESYLYDPDPEIREAALDGMLTLGDAAASPILRKAAQSAYSPHEAVAMLEAADYLELPSGKLPPIDKAAVEENKQNKSDVESIDVEKLFRRPKTSVSAQ